MNSRVALLAALALLPFPCASAQHRLVTQGEGRIAIVAADGSIEWEMPWGPIHDLHVLPSGNLMVQQGASRVVEIDVATRRVVWTYDAGAENGNEGQPVEVHAFQPLPGGNVMIAESGPARIVEVDRLGRLQHQIALEVDRPHAHTDTRLARKLESGNYLVCHEGDGKVREYAGETGEVVWEYEVPLFGREPAGGHGPEAFGNKCFAALRLASGNTLVSTGNGHSVLEVTPAKEIVWKLDQHDLASITLAWVTTLAVLENGHYVIGNCHAGPGQPLLIELDPRTKQVAWTFDDYDAFGNSVSNCELLDVGPGSEVLARARAIHGRVLTLDTHKDISARLAEEPAEDEEQLDRFRERFDPSVWGTSQVDFPKMRAGGLDVAFFIVYVGQGPLTDEGYALAKNQALAKFDAIHRMARRFPDEIALALTPDDVERAVVDGKLVACIGIENGYAMGTDPSLIEEFHRRGARYMSISHNGHSQLGDSYTPDEPLHDGLSDLGRRAIEELNRVGIMVDVSHAGKKTMMEAVAHSKAPVIASHSGSRAVCDHGRNLDDEQLRALAANGGVLQAVAFASYVKADDARTAALRGLREELDLPRRRGTDPVDMSPEAIEKRRVFRERVAEIEARHPRADVSDFVDHIDHAVELIGIDHVAISSDFDGGGGVTGWNDASETFEVTLELVRRGYTEEEIAKLWSGNTLRVWREVEHVARELADEGR